MEEFISKWLFDPTVGKLVMAVLGIAVVYTIVHFLQRSVARYVEETEMR